MTVLTLVELQKKSKSTKWKRREIHPWSHVLEVCHKVSYMLIIERKKKIISDSIALFQPIAFAYTFFRPLAFFNALGDISLSHSLNFIYVFLPGINLLRFFGIRRFSVS